MVPTTNLETLLVFEYRGRHYDKVITGVLLDVEIGRVFSLYSTQENDQAHSIPKGKYAVYEKDPIQLDSTNTHLAGYASISYSLKKIPDDYDGPRYTFLGMIKSFVKERLARE